MTKKKKKNVRALEGNLFDVLKFIYVYKQEHDYSPSIREMCAAIKTPAGGPLSSSVCRYDMSCLQKMNYIDWVPGEARTVHLTPLGKAVMQTYSLPRRIEKAQDNIQELLQEIDELVAA